MKTTAKKTIPRIVDFLTEHDDGELLRYIGLGYSNRLIAERTTLTPSQINYRAMKLRGLGITRADYRNGVGVVSQIVERAARKQIDDALSRYLKEHL
jgi:hypothetical protein